MIQKWTKQRSLSQRTEACREAWEIGRRRHGWIYEHPWSQEKGGCGGSRRQAEPPAGQHEGFWGSGKSQVTCVFVCLVWFLFPSKVLWLLSCRFVTIKWVFCFFTNCGRGSSHILDEQWWNVLKVLVAQSLAWYLSSQQRRLDFSFLVKILNIWIIFVWKCRRLQ